MPLVGGLGMDHQDGERIEDNKGRSFAIGPSIKYSGESGWFVTAKWSKKTEYATAPKAMPTG